MTPPRYLLDTNIVSDLVRNPQGKVAQSGRLARLKSARASSSRQNCAMEPQKEVHRNSRLNWK